MAIPNRYKNILDDFIDRSNPEFLLGPIDEKLRNAPRSKSDSTGLPKENCLDEDVSASNRSSQLAAKTRDFQLHQRRDVASFGPKNRRAQYGKSQRRRESGQRNKINLMVRGNSGFEANIYHHKIYRY